MSGIVTQRPYSDGQCVIIIYAFQRSLISSCIVCVRGYYIDSITTHDNVIFIQYSFLLNSNTESSSNVLSPSLEPNLPVPRPSCFREPIDSHLDPSYLSSAFTSITKPNPLPSSLSSSQRRRSIRYWPCTLMPPPSRKRQEGKPTPYVGLAWAERKTPTHLPALRIKHSYNLMIQPFVM